MRNFFNNQKKFKKSGKQKKIRKFFKIRKTMKNPRKNLGKSERKFKPVKIKGIFPQKFSLITLFQGIPKNSKKREIVGPQFHPLTLHHSKKSNIKKKEKAEKRQSKHPRTHQQFFLFQIFIIFHFIKRRFGKERKKKSTGWKKLKVWMYWWKKIN